MTGRRSTCVRAIDQREASVMVRSGWESSTSQLDLEQTCEIVAASMMHLSRWCCAG